MAAVECDLVVAARYVSKIEPTDAGGISPFDKPKALCHTERPDAAGAAGGNTIKAAEARSATDTGPCHYVLSAPGPVMEICFGAIFIINVQIFLMCHQKYADRRDRVANHITVIIIVTDIPIK